MVKGKSSKTESIPPKRKSTKTTSDADEAPAETVSDGVVKKKTKRRPPPAEEAPAQIAHVTITPEDSKPSKAKKPKKKKKNTETTQTEKPKKGTLELEGEEDLSPEEKRVLERKMKKILKKEAKNRLKSEGETAPRTEASGPTAPQQALDYLACWAENRTAWKFQKTRQTWLLQHMFDSEKVPDERFSVLLQYLEGLQGGAKDITVQKALALVEESGLAPEDVAIQQRARRARDVIQLLS